MKVLFWLNSFPTVSETFIRNQIVDLINEGVEVQIFCSSKSKESLGLEGFEHYNLLNKTKDFSDLVPSSRIKKIKSFITIFSNSFISLNFMYFIKLFKLVLTERKEYPFSLFFVLNYILNEKMSVVHCHFGPVGKKAVFLKKIGVPIKLVCTFHGYDIRLGLSKGTFFYKDLFKYADSIISISNYNREKLLFFGAQHDKIEDLNNGVQVNCKINKSYTEGQQIKILSVGRLVEEKGYGLALNAIALFIKKYPKINFHYDIIGGGVLEKQLTKKCIDLGIDSVVIFHLAQNSEYVKHKMLEADFLFLPSINEAIPTVILEAQSFSLPVVATNVGSVKELVINDVTGFLADVSEVDLVRCLKKMFDNEEKWQQYGFNAKKNIKENYNRAVLVHKLLNIYKS